MLEYTTTRQFIPAHTDLSWNTVNPESQLIFKNPTQDESKAGQSQEKGKELPAWAAG